jgi:hypothetical protein
MTSICRQIEEQYLHVKNVRAVAQKKNFPSVGTETAGKLIKKYESSSQENSFQTLATRVQNTNSSINLIDPFHTIQ